VHNLLLILKMLGKNKESKNKQFISHVNYRDLFNPEISEITHIYIINNSAHSFK
jgi:hypothetical protein